MATKTNRKKVSDAPEGVSDQPTTPSLPPQPGQKRVREVSTKTEEYFEPQQPPPVDETDEVPEADEDFEDDEEEEIELSPVDRFLQNNADVTDAVVYVIRKPDPPTSRIKFRNPCNQKMTVGEIPFDESFRDKETVDLAVQSTFEGGHYLLQVRQRGVVRLSWSSVIADPPAAREPVAAGTTQTPNFVQQGAPKERVIDPLDKLLADAAKFAKLREVLGVAEAQPAQASAAQDPELSAMKFLMDNTEFKENFVKRVLVGADNSDEEPMPWFGRVLMAAAGNPQLAPLIAQAGSAILQSSLAQSMLANKQAQQQQQPPSSAGAPTPRPNAAGGAPRAAQPSAPPAQTPIEPEVVNQVEDFDEDDNDGVDDSVIGILEPLVACLLLNRDIEIGDPLRVDLQEKIQEFAADYPTEAREFFALLTGSVDDLMGYIATLTPTFGAAMTMSHAREWIERFKLSLGG